MNISWKSWVFRACVHIRFKPDRGPVEEELLAHLEDRAEALCQSGMGLERAEKQAMASMGDADEVGRQLAAVHKPLLGWAWRVSRWALAISLVLALFVIVERFANGWSYLPHWDTELRWWQGRELSGQVVELSSDSRDESGGCTITVPAAAVQYGGPEHVNGRLVDEMVSLYFTIEAAGQAGTVTAFYDFYAVDDLGNVYPSRAEYEHGTSAYLGKCSVSMVISTAGPFRSTGKGSIGFIDPSASWIELRYDREGRDVRLRIDLTGGEEG